MTDSDTIIALGEQSGPLARSVERARDLGFRVVCEKTALAAIEQARRCGHRFGAGLIDIQLATLDLRAALDALRLAACDNGAIFLATGEQPNEETLATLRKAGVERALWEPIGDSELRFQLSEALAGAPRSCLRAHRRVPTQWKARVIRAGRSKLVSVYCVSGGGAFLETPRASMKGAELAIELALPTRDLTLIGEVVYANVPGSITHASLPHGMAVRFVRSDEATRQAIAARVCDWSRHSLV